MTASRYVDEEGAVEDLGTVCKNISSTSLPPVVPVTYSLYPNPIGDFAYVSFDEGLYSGILELFDIDGQLLETREFENRKIIDIDLTDFVAGSYVAVLRVDGHTLTEILIKP